MEKLKPYIYLFIGAILYTLGFPNILDIYIPFTPILGTSIILYYVFSSSNLKSKITYYLYYNLIITAISFYWITETLQEFGKIPFVLAALMNSLYAFLLNPQFLIVIALLGLNNKYKYLSLNKWNKTGIFSFITALVFVCLEYFIPQQFPVMLGQPWIVLSKYLGLAPIFGLPAFSFFSYLLSFEIYNFIKNKRFSIFNLASVLVFIIANPILKTHESGEKFEFNIRLVQANISNFLKVESESGGYASVSQVLNRYKELSIKPFSIKDKNLDLIVWPETAFPFPIHTNKDDLEKSPVPFIFQSIIRKTKSNLLIGGYDHFKDNPDGTYYKTEYNSALYFNSNEKLSQVYHKHILIPFGETLPLGPLNKWASSILPEMAFFEQGSKFTLFDTNKKIKFISSICYEILQPEFIRSYLNALNTKPHLMINLTNDSWYGNTVEPEQHLFLTRWRAIEFDLPILRSTNTGISTYITADGEELKRIEYDVTGNLDLSLQISNPSLKSPTFFQRFGFWGIFPIWLLFFLFHGLWIKLKYDKNV